MNIAKLVTTRYTTKAYDPQRKISSELMEQLQTLLRYPFLHQLPAVALRHRRQRRGQGEHRPRHHGSLRRQRGEGKECFPCGGAVRSYRTG